MDGTDHYRQAEKRADGARHLAKQVIEQMGALATSPDMGDDEAVAVIMGSIVGYASAVVGMLGANVEANLAIAAATVEASGRLDDGSGRNIHQSIDAARVRGVRWREAFASTASDGPGGSGGAPEGPEAGNGGQRTARQAAGTVETLLDGWRADHEFMFVKSRDEESWADLRAQVTERILRTGEADDRIEWQWWQDGGEDGGEWVAAASEAEADELAARQYWQDPIVESTNHVRSRAVGPWTERPAR
jgi:hypothetical protein